MNKVLITLVAGASVVFSAGCATKNHVRKEMAPVVNKVNELDDMTARNTRDIRDLDSRAQQGIAGVNAKAAEADQKATVAGQRATEAQTLASQASTRAENLATAVINLDNYRPVAEASVHFGFDKANLTKKAKAALDELAAEVPNTKGYILELTGGTDSVGNALYNYDLSERRAAAVVQYLAQEHSIPAHKVYIIGLGKDKAVESNRSARGRAKNRRVDIRLMTNVVEGQPQPVETSSAVTPQSK